MKALLFRSLDPASKDLSNAPGLGYAAARIEWSLGIKNLAQRPDAGNAQRDIESFKKGSGLLQIAWMDSQPRVDEWAHEPWPDGALMISGIARSQIAIVFRLVVRVSRIESAKSYTR